jgi:hypothetical protein
MVADVSPDLRRQGYLRREKNANFGNVWATTVGKTKTVRSSEYGSLHVGQSAPKTSSGATLVAVPIASASPWHQLGSHDRRRARLPARPLAAGPRAEAWPACFRHAGARRRRRLELCAQAGPWHLKHGRMSATGGFLPVRFRARAAHVRMTGKSWSGKRRLCVPR